ncbi:MULTISPECIES: hypothetical protein [unclassified Halorubrum]|uniref:DUF7562 family protein n=1 Tax=unclassified Halorubrum TaxID=2642239 RepID=UPI00268A78DF
MTMSDSRVWGDDANQEVTCIACGATLDREDAREYDKHGDRWSREGKEFEYLCKPCDRECCHQTRDGLEEALLAAGAGRVDRETFLRRFCQ